MKLPTKKEVENDAIQFANSSPRPATFVNGWMKCYERFIEPLMQVNGAETSQDKALNLADVKASVEFAFKVSRAMKEIGSSQIYFLMQQAYGDIDWDEVTQIWDKVQTEVKHLP
jgi:3-methyladenine DNA glycosylase Tag